jgi:hypothetical protein
MASTTISVANPHTNDRPELGVKTVKRMLMDIVAANGILDRAVVSRALLFAKAGVCSDGGHVDEPGGCQGGRETAQARRANHSEKKWSDHMKALAP